MEDNLIKKSIAISIIVLFAGAGVASAYHVNIQGDYKLQSLGKTWYVGGNGTGNYTKIQDAIDNASSGDRVFVFSGTYYENLLVNKSITLIGDNRDTTIIDGNGKNVVYIFGIASKTNISYFTIQNTLDNGIYVGWNVSSVTINQCIIQNCYVGIHCWHASFPLITNNIIRYNHFGILFEYTDRGQINHYNHIQNNTFYGILLDSSPGNQVFSNDISNNRAGLAVARCMQNEISQNNFIDNWKYQALWKNGHSKWNSNYWSNGKGKIHIITGIIVIEVIGITIDFFQIDFNSAKEPYTIP